MELANEVNSTYKLVESVDEELVSQLSWTAAGIFPPLATAIGGLVAQEVLISLTGKFSPLRQWVRRERESENEEGRGEIGRMRIFQLNYYHSHAVVPGCV